MASNGRGNTLLTALNRAAKKKPSVHQLPEKKESKGMQVRSSSSYWPPTLYLDTKDFPGVSNFKAGDVVQMAITAKVNNVNIDQQAGKKDEYHANLTVTAIADLSQKAGEAK